MKIAGFFFQLKARRNLLHMKIFHLTSANLKQPQASQFNLSLAFDPMDLKKP